MSKKISQLPALGVALISSDIVPVVHAGITSKATITQLTALVTTAFQAADTVLTNNLNTEITNRTNADSTLQSDINNRIKKDGSVAFTANQPVAGFKFTGLGAGTGAGDSVRWEQVIQANGAINFSADQNFGTHKATNLGDPTISTDAVTYNFLKNNQSTWNLSANFVNKTLDSSYTVTSGTTKNIVIIGGVNVVTVSRTITIANGANSDNKFRFYFPQFKVSAGLTLTITDGVSSIVFPEGTNHACVVDYVNSQFWIQNDKLVVADGAQNEYGIELKWYKATYDFANSGGAIGNISLQDNTLNNVTLPANSIILHNQAFIEVETPFTSGGAATVSWGYTGTTAAFDALNAFSGSPYTGANLVKSGSVTTIEKLTSAKDLTMSVAVAALTAGRAHLYIPVIINKF